MRETREATNEQISDVAASIRELDRASEAMKSFVFPPAKPAVAAEIKRRRIVSRTPAQMAALLAEPEISAAVFGTSQSRMK